MTETTNRYGIYRIDYTKFGGIIYPSDFNTDYRGKDNTGGSQIASRIESDSRREEKLYRSVNKDKIMEDLKNVKRNDASKM